MSKYAHRDLAFAPHDRHPQQGEDVRRAQLSINKALKAGKYPTITVDGVCGRQTIAQGRLAAKILGLTLHKPGLTVSTQRVIRHPSLRTPAQRKAAKAWWERRKKSLAKRAAQRKAEAHVEGNTVKGGSVRERIVAGALAAAANFYAGRSHRFYSQAGAWTVEHGITGESHGFRSDCSQWVTSIFHSAGAPDPNGQDYKGGYTGTLVAHCREIRESELRPGDLIIYGPGVGHHVELYVGPGSRTVGHGSPPVDYGDIHMIAGARFFRPPGLD